jgi:hypothetical protein
MKEAGADSVMTAEDWGTQRPTLINPDLWREVFRPRFVDLCAYARALGLKVFIVLPYRICVIRENHDAAKQA